MAGDDHKADTKGNITNYIERKVRDLLEYDMNEYQSPAWAKAAELFKEVVVPCEIYCSEELHALGIDIVNEAEKHDCRAAYQRIPGTYNAKLISGDGYTGSDNKVDAIDYSETVNSIKVWVTQNEEWYRNTY